MAKYSMLYPKEIIEHFKKPKNLGKIRNADAIGEAGNLLCGDTMKIYLKIKNGGEGKILDIKGEVFGCVVAIANTSLLTTLVKGKTLKEAMKIKKEELIKRLGGRNIPPLKIHCSILALDALHEAIYNYYKKKCLEIPKELKERHEIIQKTLKKIEKKYRKFVEFERKLLAN